MKTTGLIQKICPSDPIRRQIIWTKVVMFIKKWFATPVQIAGETSLPEPDVMSMPHICPGCAYADADGSCVFGLNQDVDKVVKCNERDAKVAK